jgi:hypothetical protein
MGTVKNYIVRIYRYEKGNPKKIVGVVEEPEIEGKRAFTSLDELWSILNPEKERQGMKADKEE